MWWRTSTTSSSSRPEPPERRIAASVYESLKAGGVAMGLFPAVAKRIGEILAADGDPDRVELVCLTIADRDGHEFSAWRSLGWGTYEYIRDQMRIPDGLWRYALWERVEADEALRRSVDYWIGVARDAHRAGDRAGVDRAAEMLDRLWGRKVMGEAWI